MTFFQFSFSRFASSGKDGSIRIWDVVMGQCLRILTSHTQSVTCLKWGGCGLIYSGSQDRSVKVWRAEDVSERISVSHNNLRCSLTFFLRV